MNELNFRRPFRPKSSPENNDTNESSNEVGSVFLPSQETKNVQNRQTSFADNQLLGHYEQSMGTTAHRQVESNHSMVPVVSNREDILLQNPKHPRQTQPQQSRKPQKIGLYPNPTRFSNHPENDSNNSGQSTTTFVDQTMEAVPTTSTKNEVAVHANSDSNQQQPSKFNAADGMNRNQSRDELSDHSTPEPGAQNYAKQQGPVLGESKEHALEDITTSNTNILSHVETGQQKNKVKESIAVVGNIGTGKSTILNSLIGRPQFRCGGLSSNSYTTHIECALVDDRFYYDTPGMNDRDRYKYAGEQIDMMLRVNHPLKIIFIVTLSGDRVTPEDTATISIVLEALESRMEVINGTKYMSDRFAVIINQVPLDFIQNMYYDPDIEKKLRMKLTGKWNTTHWFYILYDGTLITSENSMLTNERLLRFVEDVPISRPAHCVVRKINSVNFEEHVEKCRELHDQIERNFLRARVKVKP